MKNLARSLVISAVASISTAEAIPTQAPEPVVVVVKNAGSEDVALQAMWRALHSRGVNDHFATTVLKGFDEHLHERVRRQNVATRLYPVAIVDFVEAARKAGWESAPITRVLVDVQKEIDGGANAPEALYQRALADVTKAKGAPVATFSRAATERPAR